MLAAFKTFELLAGRRCREPASAGGHGGWAGFGRDQAIVAGSLHCNMNSPGTDGAFLAVLRFHLRMINGITPPHEAAETSREGS